MYAIRSYYEAFFNIFPHGSGKQNRILHDQGDVMPDAGDIHVHIILTVNEDASACGTVKPGRKIDNGTFPCPGLPHNAHGPALSKAETDIFQYRNTGCV